MCGASTFTTGWTNTDPCARRLHRNVSSNSSYANNTFTSTPRDDALEDDRVACPVATNSDTWNANASFGDGLTVSSDYDSIRSHPFSTPAMAPQQPGPQQLLLGTSSGIFQLNLHSCHVQHLALASVPVAHLAYSSCGLVLAACPAPDQALYGELQCAEDAAAAAGLYCLNLKDRSSSSCFSDTQSTPALKLWQGGATCCAFAPQQPAACNEQQAVPRIYLGTQPADLIYSDDLGGSWATCELSEAPQADGWFRRLPPYEPSVRAINFAGSSSAAVAAADSTDAAAPAGSSCPEQAQLLVAVEVGGVLSSTQPGPQHSGSSWVECSQALCKDVQALQADPFNPRVLYAVAGSGHLPGGLYRCKGKGQKWRRLFGYRYSVGMALSAFQKGRMLLISADKPPATGCILFESVDGGRSWVNISDDVADAVADITGHDADVFDQAPLTMFVPGALIIACATGHVFMGTPKPLGGYSSWKLLATLPAAVNCLCSMDPAVAPVAIQRA